MFIDLSKNRHRRSEKIKHQISIKNVPAGVPSHPRYSTMPKFARNTRLGRGGLSSRPFTEREARSFVIHAALLAASTLFLFYSSFFYKRQSVPVLTPYLPLKSSTLLSGSRGSKYPTLTLHRFGGKREFLLLFHGNALNIDGRFVLISCHILTTHKGILKIFVAVQTKVALIM